MTSDTPQKQYTIMASGVGALMVWMIFSVLIPLVSALIVSAVIFYPYDTLFSAQRSLGIDILVGVGVSMMASGLISALIGALMAVRVHRIGRVSLAYAILVTLISFMGFAAGQWLISNEIPGAFSASFTHLPLSRWLLIVAAFIVAAAVSWWVSLPIQRRSI